MAEDDAVETRVVVVEVEVDVPVNIAVIGDVSDDV